MKKSYFWGLLLAIMALIPSQNAFAEYCTMSSTFSNSDRHLDSFTLTDGVEELAVSSVQPNSGSNWWPSYKVYNDHTSKSLTTQPGATLYFKSLSWTGSWMHGYVFIDYNQDETFDASEAVSYNFYSEAGTDTGVNSKGESVSNNCGVTAGNMPSWTLPTDLPSGTYRLRLKIDWNSLDACGASDIVANRGCIADITLNVEAAIPERTIDVTVTPEGAGTVTGAGTAMGNITLVATPTPGYEFVNWTLNGEVVSTEMSYTDATEGNKSYVANFAALTAYPEMSYMYTNGMDQANRYLKEVVATAGETVTTVFSATSESELPKIDPNVVGMATTVGAYVDKTATPIIVPQGTTEFTVNFKAWTESMTIGTSSANCQLQWTQQAAFIDWNNNFCFYEEGENYGKSSDTMGNDGGVCQSFISETGYTRTFSVPADVKPGVYRMRVCYFEPDGNNAQQWQNTIFEKGNCTTRNGKTYDFAIEVIGVTPETPVYAVSVSTADEAMGTAEVSATEVEEGTEVTFTATAAEGYQFVNWTSGEEVVSTENPYTVAVTAEMALTANFELIPVTKYAVSVTTVDGAMGTAEVSATEVEEGDEVTFTATANLGYKFIGWLANGETVSTENPYTTAVTAEMSLVANFEEIALENEFVVTVDKVDQEWQFVVAAEDEDSKLIKVDWGNGELVSYEILSYWGSVSPWETTITGTPVGDGTVKVYAANLYKFDCSYNQNYGAKVTSVDLSKAGALKSFIASTNSLTSLDLTANAELTSVSVNGNSELSTIVWPSTNVLTTVDFSDCAFTALDLSACTSLTTLKVNNNTGMGGINVSALTALTSLYANNIGLTTIDLSANTKLKYLYVNDNQLTKVDVSNMVAGLYLYANNNQLTSIVAGESNVTSKSRIQILNNNFTLATLPAFTAITKIGTSGYNYAPQKAMTIAAEINEGEELDLSAQNNIVGRATEAQATVYTWYTADGTEFTNYTVEGGKFVFNVTEDTELYCTMTSEAFSSFSGSNALTTTNILVKNLVPAIIVKHAEANIERQFTFDATEEGATIFIDWGDGNLQEYAIAYYDNWDAWETTINGTILGDGTVKIYGDQIHMFDCSYSSSYPVKVTEVNVANCPSLYEFSCYTNEITSLDLTSNATLVKVYANGNPALNNIEFAAENAMTTLDLSDCAFTTLDLSSCTSLTSLSVNNNTGLGSLDVTALTALKTLNANNIGLTSIDLSANVKLATLKLNDNQLTTVDVSNMVAGLYLYANNNQLTSIVAGESNVTSKSRIQILNNNFTLATLPAFTAITKVGTSGYNYAPQKPLAIAAEINEGEELDLSAQNNIVGRATEAQATVYTWYTADGTEFTNYTVEGGKFVFNVTEDTELYCAMTTEAFPSFSGTNAFTTTNIVVKYVPVERKVQFKSSDIVMGTVQIISPSQGGTGTGGTGTGGTGTGGTGTSGTGTSGTGTSGTGTGSATSGGGQSPWVITTEDVTAQASVQGNAYEFVNWTIGEEIVGTELTYTYTGEEEALIQANFRQKDTYKTITIDVKPVVKDEFGTNIVGSVKFQGRSGKTAIIEQGSSLTAVATAKEGYEFSSWKDASTGEDVSFDAEYTFTVAADINLEAWFSELPVVTTCQVLVNIAPTEDYGTVVIEGVEGLLAEVEVGTEVTAVATPAEGKIFEGWFTFEGDELSTNATYTFTATEDVVVVAWFTDAPEAEYCTYEGKSTHSERRLNAVTITDGTNSTAVSSIQPYFRGDVYVDKTDVVFPSYAGATVNFSEFDFKGEWMHAYVYIDYNNDKVFNTTVNADGTTGGELVSFTFYSATDAGTGVNSLGETVSNYAIPMVDYLPAFTLPKDLEDGEYRVRVKIDWCHLDPCGHPTETANKLTANGGCIADFTMSISDFNGVEFTEAEVAQVYAADGVIYINGYEGDVKVVNAAGQVIKDVNVNGNDTLEVAAGLYIVVTGDQVTKVVVK